jgi:class 3 adenylate cyclase
MRSDARLLTTSHNSCYATKTIGGLVVGGASAQKICDLKTSVLLQKVDSPVITKALNGKKGTEETISYSGKKVLAAYSPLQLGELKYAIISQIDLDEANKPINAFQKELGISTVILASIITFLAMLLAHFFTKPIDILMKGVHKLSNGETDIHIELNRADEYGELAKVMNSTGKLIQQQQQEIQCKEKENKTLLLNILPKKVARQLELGETKISERVSNVSVVYTTLRGFSENLDVMDPERAISLLNDLIEAFDTAAEKYDVEKVKTIGDSYLAASGLNISRLDHASRCVQFGFELLKIVQDFNNKNSTKLALRVAIHSGSVLAGVVGKRNFAYDLWGETVNIAGRIRFEAPINSLIITDDVYSRLADKSLFTKSRTISTHGMGHLEIWLHTMKNHSDVNLPTSTTSVQHA